MEAYRLEHVTFTYPGRERPALKDLSLEIGQGEFVVVCGPSGCGKTTLLRQLKPALTPHGTRAGTVLFRGRQVEELDRRTQASAIGFVMQVPEDQVVTDKVWHELAFGLESLGEPVEQIRLRVAEMAAFFGMEEWFHRDTATLSGGQKQLLNLAAVMAMQPEVLLLDEPTSQLDPVAARTFLDSLARIHRELGTTVILSEHRLEEALPLATRCVVLDGGQIAAEGTPVQVGERLRTQKHAMFRAMPTPMRVWAATESTAACPVTVGEGRTWLADYGEGRSLAPLKGLDPEQPEGAPVLEVDEVWFRYHREGADVLKGLSVTVRRGERFALLGGNGAGKTTLLSLLTGSGSPLRGQIRLYGKPLPEWTEGTLFENNLALLPQNPKSLFVGKTVREDLAEQCSDPEAVAEVASRCRLNHLMERHPYDLSGGEQQRAALAKVLLTRPKLLLLDEPTKGMDPPFQEEFAELLEGLSREGVTILMVTHDVEFCARHATRCALLFDGQVQAEGTPRAFFTQNGFYTTAASRMARQLLPEAMTAEEVIKACGGREPEVKPASQAVAERHVSPAGQKKRRSPGFVRVLGGVLLAGCALCGTLAWQGVAWLAPLAAGKWLPSLAWLAALMVSLAMLGVGRKPSGARAEIRPRPEKPKRRGVALISALFVALIPLTLAMGAWLLEDRKYYFISLLVLLEALIPVLLTLERRETGSRKLTALAVLCALAVVGRAAFFMLPQFKPVAAVVIIAGIAFGGQSGFLVGAVSMLVSNLMYTQGAWTPWQMTAMGVIGLLAGLLTRAGLLGRGRLGLCIYGFAAAMAIYGGIMNVSHVLIYQPNPTWEMALTAMALGVPFDIVHGAATGFFLWAGGPALLEKLDRVKEKYGF